MFAVLPNVLNKKYVVIHYAAPNSRPEVVSRHDSKEDASYTAERLNKVLVK